MLKWLDDLHKKSELYFALVWIGVYCVVNSLANPLSAAIGIDSSFTLVFNVILSVIMFMWIKAKGLMKYYGLCSAKVKPKKFLWYIPLVVFVSHNLWFGFAINLPLVDTVCYILSMFCVGFLEEVIFRGFLFKALEKDNAKTAIIISSVTFGIGHIMNLFNGSGMELLSNMLQVVGAIACGFLFVIIFTRSGSLVACIIAHSVNNAVSVFSDTSALTTEKQLILSGINMIVVVVYTLVLCKTTQKEN